jgi:hypothetical protein
VRASLGFAGSVFCLMFSAFLDDTNPGEFFNGSSMWDKSQDRKEQKSTKHLLKGRELFFILSLFIPFLKSEYN